MIPPDMVTHDMNIIWDFLQHCKIKLLFYTALELFQYESAALLIQEFPL